MKKHLLALSAAAVLLAPNAVGAEGFSINEWSAEGFAMGGARMFAENDAANMAYNPASLTKIKGEVAKISATYISPHGKYECYGPSPVDGKEMVYDAGHNRIHPAWAPGMYYAKQLNDKEFIGFGSYARFGNSCQFKQGSLPGVNNTSSKVNGMSVGLNYAKKLDSKWSASLGAEVNYAWLQIDKTAPFLVRPDRYDPSMKMQVEGESYALGWNAAANYAFDDKNEMGIVYRSAVNHSMEANVRDSLMGPSNGLPAGAITDAYGCVTLPESVMIGYGHKFNDKTRVELNGTWTRWSRFDALDMTFSGMGGLLTKEHPDAKNWKDGWRYAIGVEHKLSDKYSLLAGAAYDESGIPDYREAGDTMGADFMVPTGTRTTFTLGGQYHDNKQTVALTIGYMKVGDLFIEPEESGAYSRAKMYDSYTKLVSISYQYNF